MLVFYLEVEKEANEDMIKNLMLIRKKIKVKIMTVKMMVNMKQKLNMMMTMMTTTTTTNSVCSDVNFRRELNHGE